MKRYFKISTIIVFAISMLVVLAACAEIVDYQSSQIQPHEQNDLVIGEVINTSTAEDIATEEAGDSLVTYAPDCIGEATADPVANGIASNQTYELGVPDSIGGCFRECFIHSGHFHSLDIFIGTLVCSEDLIEWYVPLRAAMRTSPYDECLINISTFIEHFGITREAIQQLIDDTRIDFFIEYNLDVLFSGDNALIEEFYCIGNEALHDRIAAERELQYFTELLMNLQRIVNANVRMSRHYHDIWTFLRDCYGKPWFGIWMRDLVEAGHYDRVNIIEFVNHFDISREVFEQIVDERNLALFVHYNLDVIFSGDPQLIASYYSIENEAAHTAHVQAAFEQYTATHGQPDTSRLLDQ